MKKFLPLAELALIGMCSFSAYGEEIVKTYPAGGAEDLLQYTYDPVSGEVPIGASKNGPKPLPNQVKGATAKNKTECSEEVEPGKFDKDGKPQMKQACKIEVK